MDKLILVLYMGTKDMSPQAIQEHIEVLNKSLGKNLRDLGTIIVMPQHTTNENRIECINPKLLNEEQYQEVEATVNKLKEALSQWTQ